MQDSDITLSIDTLNTGVTTDSAFARVDYAGNRSTYQGPLHTPVKKDILNFYRTDAKPTDSFRGVRKCSIKVTKGLDVTTPTGENTIVPEIGSVSFSLPVEATEAQEMELRQKLIAILDDDVIMARLMHQGRV